MRRLFVCSLLFVATQVCAQSWAPPTVVAQTAYPHREAITLLTDLCNPATGTMRAQWVTRDRTVIWGCWGYNPTGVQVQWQSGRTEHIEWFNLWYHAGGTIQQLGYQGLHERVAFLRSIR